MKVINFSLLILLLTVGQGIQAGEMEVQDNDEGTWNKAGEYMDDAGKKAKSAWEATKRYSTNVMEESGSYYDAAVDKGKEVGSSLSEKSGSAWEWTKETGSDLADQAADYGGQAAEKTGAYYESAREKAGELYDEATQEPETESTQDNIREI